MKTYCFILCILISIPVFAAESIVVLPFNDESKTQQAYWLGEGFAESITEEMFLQNAYIIQRPARKAAYDALRLPYVGHVSRATMLKLGKHLGADYIVFGAYTVEQHNLKVEAHVIQTSSSRLSPPIQSLGLLDNLYSVQGQLTRALKDYFTTQKLQPVDNRNQTGSIPLHAYELYIKGLLESSEQGKVDFFQRAVNAYSDYPAANYRLALAHYRLGRYKESNAALSKISGNGILRTRIEFLTGLNMYLQNDINGSAQKWYKLSQSYPTPEVYNNIGVALLTRKEIDNAIAYLSKAVELDPEHPDFRFNLAIAFTEKGNHSEAADAFRQAIDLNPGDFQAMYWLSKSLEHEGKPEAKRVMTIFQERLPRDQKGKFPEQYPQIKQLLRLSSGYLAKEEKEYAEDARSKAAKQRGDYLKTYQGSARKHLEDRHPERAILEIQKGLTFAPFDWYLHHLWGLAMIAQGDRAGAVPHLQFSLWCTENIDSHILLAEMYRDSQQYAASKKHIQQVLALDPKHKKAIEIWSKIHNKN